MPPAGALSAFTDRVIFWWHHLLNTLTGCSVMNCLLFGSVGTENLIQLCAGLNHSKTVQFIFCHSHIPWLATTRTNLDERNAVMFLRQCSLLRLFLILAQSFFSDQICSTYVVWFVSGWRTSFFWRPTFGRFVFLGDPGENEKERHDAAFKTKISTIKCH